MTGEWLQLEGYGLGKLKPAASNDLYVTPHAARSFASALGYSACVLQERGRHGKGGGGGGGGGGGVECQFYRGSGAELYSRRKKEKGARLLVCLSEGADAAAAAADERAEDSWELVESECVDKVVAASMCRAQNELSDAHKQHQASLLRQRQITDEFWADLASAPTLTPTSTVSVFEHERWMPFAGWTSPPFPRDTPHFTYEDGTPAPKLHLVSPPRGTRWNPSGPRSKWMHEPPQGSPPAAAAADAGDKSGGWEYAMDFSMTPYRPRCRITDMVRRRKWTRVYVTPAHDGGGRQRSGGGGGGGAAAAEAAEAAAASDADEEVGEGVAARRSGRQQQQPAYHSDSSSSR